MRSNSVKLIAKATKALAAAYLAEYNELKAMKPEDRNYSSDLPENPVEYLREQMFADGLEECLLDEMRELTGQPFPKARI